jgi:hypothetical protein
MKESIFNGKLHLTLDNPMEILPLKEEINRYEHLPRLMNLFRRFNGFFDDRFESFWEEKTVLPWKEWGKL